MERGPEPVVLRLTILTPPCINSPIQSSPRLESSFWILPEEVAWKWVLKRPLSALWAGVCCRLHWHACPASYRRSHGWPGRNLGILPDHLHKHQVEVTLSDCRKNTSVQTLIGSSFLYSESWSLLPLFSVFPFLGQALMTASKQLAWYPSWLWGLAPSWLHSTGSFWDLKPSWWFCCQPHYLGEPTLIWPTRVAIICSPIHFTSLPRTNYIRFGGGRAYLKPTGHSTLSASPPQAFISEMSMLKYWGTLNVLLLRSRFTTGIPHLLNSLWQTRVPKLHSWALFLLDWASVLRFATSYRYFGQTVTPSLWQLSKIFLGKAFSSLQWVLPSFHR